MLHHLSPRHLLRQSAMTRLILALVILLPLWLAIHWAASLS